MKINLSTFEIATILFLMMMPLINAIGPEYVFYEDGCDDP